MSLGTERLRRGGPRIGLDGVVVGTDWHRQRRRMGQTNATKAWSVCNSASDGMLNYKEKEDATIRGQQCQVGASQLPYGRGR